MSRTRARSISEIHEEKIFSPAGPLGLRGCVRETSWNRANPILWENNCEKIGVKAASRDSLWGLVDIELSCHVHKSLMNLNFSAGCPNREKLKMKLSSVDKVLERTAETSGIPEEKVRNRDATPSDGTFLESVGFISRHPS